MVKCKTGVRSWKKGKVISKMDIWTPGNPLTVHRRVNEWRDDICSIWRRWCCKKGLEYLRNIETYLERRDSKPLREQSLDAEAQEKIMRNYSCVKYVTFSFWRIEDYWIILVFPLGKTGIDVLLCTLQRATSTSYCSMRSLSSCKASRSSCSHSCRDRSRAFFKSCKQSRWITTSVLYEPVLHRDLL